MVSVEPYRAADTALFAALHGVGEGVARTREELVDDFGVPPALLEAMAREGLLDADEDGRYRPEDVEALRAGLALLGAGVPLAELLGLARHAHGALAGVAEQSVELFLRFVRDSVHGTTEDPAEATQQLLVAYETMLPAATTLIALHFRRLVVSAALARAAAELGEAP